MTDDYEARKRRQRIERLKKIIKTSILVAIIVPLLTAILFIFLFARTRRELNELQVQYDDLLKSVESLRDTVEFDESDKDVYSTSDVEVSPRDDVLNDEANGADVATEENAVRHVYLTFDDGPSSNTPKILDILAEYNVKATFFVVGKTDEDSIESYKRIVDEGHTLGMHSYSHVYSQIYASEEAFAEDLTNLQEFLYDTTGVWSRYYRFPGGSSNTASRVDMKILIQHLTDLDITYFDWNIVSGDASGSYISADGIYQNCISKIGNYEDAVILMHDAAAKNSTVEALPRIIEAILELDNTVIVPMDDTTVPVQHQSID